MVAADTLSVSHCEQVNMLEKSSISSLLAVVVATAALAGCPSVPNFGYPEEPQDASGDTDTDAPTPLSLERITPSSGFPEGGERVAIFGAGIQRGAKVFFGEEPATGVLVLDENRVNCNAPPSEELGLVDVKVQLPDGTEEILEQAYLYRGPLEIHTIEPTIAPTTGGLEVTITGAGFDDTTRFLVGGRLLFDPQRIDDTTVKGILPARLQGTPGAVSVVASNGFEQRVLARGFNFVDELRVDWLSRNTGSIEGGTVVTLYGSGLVDGTAVLVGSKSAEVVAGGKGNSLTIRVPPGPEGRVNLIVNNGLETETVASGFTYASPEDLEDPDGDGVALLGAYPPRGNASGGQQVSLAVWGLPTSGAGQGLSVTFNGVPAQVIEVRALENVIVVLTPTGAPGDAEIEVTATAGRASANGLFTFESDVAATAVSPDGGSPNGGDTVTISGQGLDADAQVFFGSQAASSVQLSGSSLRVTAPQNVPGRVDIRVLTGDKNLLLPAAYEYLTGGAGTLLAVTPPDGSQAGDRLLRLYGHGFRSAGVPDITMGGEPVDDDRVELIDDATIHIRSIRGEVGEVNVDAGDYGLMAMSFEYFDPTAGYGGTSGGTIPEAINITVLEQVSREPIDEAFVILWDDLGTPYQGLTDDRGQVTFSDPMFGPPQMVTASKDNHSTSSIVDFDARNVTLYLISYAPSNPGGGGGGGGPQQLPPSVLTGDVGGIDKYIVPPPGNCEPHVGKWGTVCDECQTDADCLGEGEFCTDLQEQGKRCTAQCSTDADCESGFVCKGVGDGMVQCVPSPGLKEVWCGTTQPDIFSYDTEDTAPVAEVSGLPISGFSNGASDFIIDTEPGEYAIVCLGGYYDKSGPEHRFTPTVMGVRRNVFAQPGETISSQDIKLDIPLTRSLSVRLDGAPLSAANYHVVDTFIDFGADGVFRMPAHIEAFDVNEFQLHRFPAKFEESLYNASYSFYARAYNNSNIPEATAASFVLHQDVLNPYQDSVFKIQDQGVAYTTTGITVEINAMHGWGGDRVWAAATEGTILTYDGNWWGRQLTPVRSTLRGVWAANDTYIWAVGDNGAVVRGDGIAWKEVAMPRSLENVNWEGVFGVGADVWMWGDDGVYVHDGVQVFPKALGDDAGRPEVVHGVWGETPDAVWLVGEEGLIRRYNGTNFEAFDQGGTAFRAVSGSRADSVWAVGDNGRIAHYDGNVWFDFLPVTRFDLYSVHAVSDDQVWAAGDNGVVLQWDGLRWKVQSEIEHIDLRGTRVAGDGTVLTGGIHTLILGPFMDIAEPSNPMPTGQWTPWSLNWNPGKAPDPTFTQVYMLENGFPFWQLIVAGHRSFVPLPDLTSAWGIDPFPPVQEPAGAVQLVRVYMPGESIDRFDYTMINQYEWRSWSITSVPAVWP